MSLFDGHRSALALAAAALCSLAAQAARPLNTDDAGVIAPRGCEVEAGRAVQPLDGARDASAALACGLGLDTQFGMAVAQGRGPEGRSRAAVLALKTGLWAGSGVAAPSLAVSGALAWGRATGQRWARESSEVRLIGTLPVSHAFLHVNLGHARSHGGGPQATTWGLALEHQPLTWAGLGWAPLAEVYGDDRGERWVSVGMRTTVLPDRLFVDLAWARQQAPDRARVWNTGLRFAF